MRLLAAVVGIALICVCTLAFADTIHLKNKDQIGGEIVEETDQHVRIKTPYGVLRIPKKEIDHIEWTPRVDKELLEKKEALAEEHYELAMWAKKKGLDREAQANLEAAIALDPDHEKTRAALGYVKEDGRWVRDKLEEKEEPEEREEPEEEPEEEEEKEKMSIQDLLQAHQEAAGHIQSGDYKKALKIYKRILRSYPDDPTANYNAACALALENKAEEALDYLEDAIGIARKLYDSGTGVQRQQAKSLLDLLETDPDLDSLRDTKKYKKILRIAKGEKVKPKEEPEEEPEKPKKKSRDF